MALDRSPELRLAMKVHNQFSDFGRGSFRKHFYDIILKLGSWPTSRYC